MTESPVDVAIDPVSVMAEHENHAEIGWGNKRACVSRFKDLCDAHCLPYRLAMSVVVHEADARAAEDSLAHRDGDIDTVLRIWGSTPGASLSHVARRIAKELAQERKKRELVEAYLEGLWSLGATERVTVGRVTTAIWALIRDPTSANRPEQ